MSCPNCGGKTETLTRLEQVKHIKNDAIVLIQGEITYEECVICDNVWTNLATLDARADLIKHVFGENEVLYLG